MYSLANDCAETVTFFNLFFYRRAETVSYILFVVFDSYKMPISLIRPIKCYNTLDWQILGSTIHVGTQL